MPSESAEHQARRLGEGGGGGRWVRSNPPRLSELVTLAIKINYSLLLYAVLPRLYGKVLPRLYGK